MLLALVLFAVLPDARAWEPFGNGMDDAVSTLASDGSRLYAGGSFFMAGTASVSRAAQWSGSDWSTLGDGLQGQPLALAHDGRNLYAGGFISMAGDVPVTNVAMWNDSSWANVGNGAGNPFNGVFALLCDGPNLYAGGTFDRAGDAAVTNLAAWNGTNWTSFGAMNDAVYTLALLGPNVVADAQDVEGVATFVVRDITPMFQENAPPGTGGENILRWTSFTNRLYTVWLATNASADYVPLESNIPASPAVNVFTDSTPRPFSFYKVTTEK